MILVFRKFIQDEKGLTVVEYAVAGGLIAAAVILAFATLGTSVSSEVNAIEAIVPS